MSAELRKQAADAGVTTTGAYVEWLEAEVARREAIILACNMPLGLYRGSCGHYWDTTDIGVTTCPVCAEVARLTKQRDDYRRALTDITELLERRAAQLRAEGTEEQKAAIARAILDNDYTEMNRLKAEGRWKREDKTEEEAK